MGIFLFLVFLMGGGSRDDIQSLIILRPVAILFAAYAIIYKIEKQISWVAFPFLLLFLLATLMAIQLIPLPPEVWIQLPQRAIFSEIAILANIEQPWRPISLSPSKTWNSLFSLCVPAAMAMLFMNIAPQDRRKIVILIMLLIGLSALLGVLQTLGSSQGPLYLYQITNNGSAVGLFANRNHQSIMLAILILLLGWYNFVTQRNKLDPLKLSITIGGIFILIPLILITGSRSGLILMVPALIGTLYFIYQATKLQLFSNRNAVSSRDSYNKKVRTKTRKLTAIDTLKSKAPKIALIAIILAIIILASATVIFSRSSAFDRLFPDGNIDDFRVQVTPVLIDIASKYFLIGSGFGSFEHIYKIYEPVNLLSSLYFNQAHNDWLQFIIEGGLPAIIILILFLSWIGRNIWLIAKQWKNLDKDKITILMCLIFFALIGAASIGDYPLRVPSIASVSMVIIILFNVKILAIKQQAVDIQ